MSNPKVFEFAKEIGMTPLALMDKIREWHLPVKSHMAELEPSVLEAIKAKLSEPSKPADAAAEKKPAARKKAAGTTATAAPKTATKSAATKTAATKAATAAAPTAAPAAKPAGTVVRRKVKAAEAAPKAEEAIETASP